MSVSKLLRSLPRRLSGAIVASFLVAIASSSQTVKPAAISAHNSVKLQAEPVLVRVRVLDANGLPLDNPAEARLFSDANPRILTASTQEASIADLKNVIPGDYDLEVTSIGYKKTTQHLHVFNSGQDFSVFIYLQPDSEHLQITEVSANSAIYLKPELQRDINKGLEFSQKKQYEKALREFSKASHRAPSNPHLWYLQGTAEVGLRRPDDARKDFLLALSFDPAHEKSLLALAELQLQDDEIPAAIASLERAYHANGGGWRTQYLMATTYTRANRLPEAELHASRAVDFAARNAAPAMLLLAEIQLREGKKIEAQQTFDRISARFPGTPSAEEAKFRGARLQSESPDLVASLGDLPLPALLDVTAPADSDSPWAPPDVDNMEYPIASDVTCKSDEVLDLAQDRLNSQLLNFEKFTATEHVVHQEIERSGLPEPPKEKQFSYIVFVYPYAGNSLYLEESRDGGASYSAFPTPMITTNINSLGVALLQPANREGFTYQCEGLTNLRGHAAWQIRFEEKKDSTASIRRWRNNKATY
ncbi:MAG: tetratricopeptide repeat protein, partial [Candidatus Acidiferrum sp.]